MLYLSVKRDKPTWETTVMGGIAQPCSNAVARAFMSSVKAMMCLAWSRTSRTLPSFCGLFAFTLMSVPPIIMTYGNEEWRAKIPERRAWMQNSA